MRLGLAALILAVVLPARAAGEDVAAGGRLFERSCLFCHGPEGSGGKVKALSRSTLTPERTYDIIANGSRVGGNVMPPWKNSFTADEIGQLVAYMLSLRQPEATR